LLARARLLQRMNERTRKVHTIKVQERIKATVKKNGKSRTVTKTVTKLVNEDFTWKDLHAAEKAGMLVSQYVIGGMDRGFKVRRAKVQKWPNRLKPFFSDEPNISRFDLRSTSVGDQTCLAATY